MRKRKRVLAVLLTGCMLGTMMTGCMKQSSEGDSSNKKCRRGSGIRMRIR